MQIKHIGLVEGEEKLFHLPVVVFLCISFTFPLFFTTLSFALDSVQRDSIHFIGTGGT